MLSYENDRTLTMKWMIEIEIAKGRKICQIMRGSKKKKRCCVSEWTTGMSLQKSTAFKCNSDRGNVVKNSAC